MSDDLSGLRRTCRATQPDVWMRARRHSGNFDPWRVVERKRSGLLRYSRARGTVALAVMYAVWDRRVYVRLPEYNDACNFVDRADVALDVDASSAGRAVTARVVGMGLLLPDETLPSDLTDKLEHWPIDLATRTVVLVPEAVLQVQTDDARFPPLPQAGVRLPGTYATS